MATASIRARLMRSEIATSVGSTSIATRPALRIASSWRCEALATRIATSLLAEHADDIPIHGPFGQDQHADGPQPRAASHASDRNGKGAVALDTTLGVTACGLDRRVLGRDQTTNGANARSTGRRTKARATHGGTFDGPRSHDTGIDRMFQSAPARPAWWRPSPRLLQRPVGGGVTALVWLSRLLGLRASLVSAGLLGFRRLGLVLLGCRSLGLADLLDVLLQELGALVVPLLEPGAGLMIRTSSA